MHNFVLQPITNDFYTLGHENGELLNPCGVAYFEQQSTAAGSPLGTIAVADWGNNRVSAFHPVTGDFQGHVISDVRDFVETPYDLAADEKGSLYLTESETNFVKQFRPVYK